MNNNKKILITGGAGYIGPKLADKLLASGYTVVVLDNLSTGLRNNLNKKVQFIKADILNKNLTKLFKKIDPDIIFHLAALKSVKESLSNPIKFVQENVVGSINVLEAMRNNNIKKIIFFSTSGVYGNFVPKGGQKETQSDNPSSPYACSKLAIEKYISYYNSLGMMGIVLRFANVYGIGGKAELEGAVNKFARLSQNNKTITIDGDGRQTRDFININDLCDLCVKVTKSNFQKVLKTSMIYNVSTGIETSMNQIVKILKYQNFKYDSNGSIGQKRSVLNPKLTERVFKWKASINLIKGMEEMK